MAFRYASMNWKTWNKILEIRRRSYKIGYKCSDCRSCSFCYKWQLLKTLEKNIFIVFCHLGSIPIVPLKNEIDVLFWPIKNAESKKIMWASFQRWNFVMVEYMSTIWYSAVEQPTIFRTMRRNKSIKQKKKLKKNWKAFWLIRLYCDHLFLLTLKLSDYHCNSFPSF